MNDPTQLHVVRSTEEMLEYISDLNQKIVAGVDVPDSEIQKAILYQRDLNQHNLEKKPKRTGGPIKTALKESIKKLNLEDL